MFSYQYLINMVQLITIESIKRLDLNDSLIFFSEIFDIMEKVRLLGLLLQIRRYKLNVKINF
jgi:hypothetical protein